MQERWLDWKKEGGENENRKAHDDFGSVKESQREVWQKEEGGEGVVDVCIIRW